jgi:xanthine dehydrogenase molybdenum-binding subunit
MLTDNLLDYKLPTVLDTPHFDVDFVEPYDVTGPFGNKALGEPPAVPPTAAIRNAIKHATGVRVNATPMNPQSLFEAFRNAGLS